MRRREKEISDRSAIDAVLDESLFCHLAFAAGAHPYVIPLSFGYDGSCLYVHTAREGKKIDCIQANPRVCFAVERQVRLSAGTNNPCRWTFAFESVVGYGMMAEISDPEAKAAGLAHIVRHYADAHTAPPLSAALQNLRVWRIRIESMTGKRSNP